jgi:hypothetical protein
MPMGCIRAQFDELRFLPSGNIGPAYTAVGGAITHMTRMIRIINNTDGDMFFSDVGLGAKFFVPAGSFVLYDLTSNSHLNEGCVAVAVGTQFYVRQSTAPTKGAVYIECIHVLGQ